MIDIACVDLILKWNTAPINYCVPGFPLAASISRSEVFALQRNALLVGNAGKGALSRQLTNMMISLLSITPDAMCAAIATSLAHLMPLKSLLTTHQNRLPVSGTYDLKSTAKFQSFTMQHRSGVLKNIRSRHFIWISLSVVRLEYQDKR